MQSHRKQNRMIRKLESNVKYRTKSPEFVREKISIYLREYDTDPRITRVINKYENWLREMT